MNSREIITTTIHAGKRCSSTSAVSTAMTSILSRRRVDDFPEVSYDVALARDVAVHGVGIDAMMKTAAAIQSPTFSPIS